MDALLHVPAFADSWQCLWFWCPHCGASHMAGREYARVPNPCPDRHAPPIVELAPPAIYYLED